MIKRREAPDPSSSARSAEPPRGVQGAQPPGNFGRVTDKTPNSFTDFTQSRNPSPKYVVSEWTILNWYSGEVSREKAGAGREGWQRGGR